MNAIPKKKLCWNCDGNVAKETNNCPYCGVYLHGVESDKESSLWSPSYTPTNTQEVNSSPHYSEEDQKVATIEPNHPQNNGIENKETHSSKALKGVLPLLSILKNDFFPIFFLMSGSIFFLFGLVLLLFSHEGTFTLQWNEKYWTYFIATSLLSIVLGWYFLQKSENVE